MLCVSNSSSDRVRDDGRCFAGRIEARQAETQRCGQSKTHDPNERVIAFQKEELKESSRFRPDNAIQHGSLVRERRQVGESRSKKYRVETTRTNLRSVMGEFQPPPTPRGSLGTHYSGHPRHATDTSGACMEPPLLPRRGRGRNRNGAPLTRPTTAASGRTPANVFPPQPSRRRESPAPLPRRDTHVKKPPVPRQFPRGAPGYRRGEAGELETPPGLAASYSRLPASEGPSIFNTSDIALRGFCTLAHLTCPIERWICARQVPTPGIDISSAQPWTSDRHPTSCRPSRYNRRTRSSRPLPAAGLNRTYTLSKKKFVSIITLYN